MLNNEMIRSNDSGSVAQPATTVAPSSSGFRHASDKGVPPHQQLSRGEEMGTTAKDIVQAIFQNAKDKAATLVIRRQELKAFATELPARQPNPVIVLRLPSGRGVNVSLRYNLYTVGHIQRDMLERSIKSNHVFLLVPGCDEPLPQNQDLRKLLPNIRELQVVVQSTLPTPEEEDQA